MIDESIPVLLRLRLGNRVSFAIATLNRENGVLIAEPQAFDPTFGRFQSVALDESRLVLVAGPLGNPPMYHHVGELAVHQEQDR